MQFLKCGRVFLLNENRRQAFSFETVALEYPIMRD
jgi:hypothetical protein